jgi:glycogen debranching enzyme
MKKLFLLMAVLYLCLSGVEMVAQFAPPSPPAQQSVQQFPSTIPLEISKEAVPSKPFSVIGPRGAILGDQSGKFETWIFPWKILSGMRITANVANYPVPIDVNDHAAWIDVEPDHTTITYSHANFTVRQTMMAPKDSPDGTGVLIFYQVESSRPLTLTFSFDSVMQRMWPAASDDRPSPEWVSDAKGSGFYILHENFPDHAAALAMPTAEPGILPPYQERAGSWPLQFVLHFDPAHDSSKRFPLLVALADTKEAASKQSFAKTLSGFDTASSSIEKANAAYYNDFTAQHTTIETPDTSLNAAFSWAEVAIDQLRVQTTPGYKEEALTAGFVGSGDAARPGFGWYFGRDALWSLYAVNSYGDFATTRKELEFLLHRQRDNGQIMHEWSQTADLVDWKSLPYEYAAADATPLLQMATNDYLKISGDDSFVRSHWEQLELAWKYETTHVSTDGIYNNHSGSGWVESWVPSMPQQELYLAVLDEQASLAFANIAQSTDHHDIAQIAAQRAEKLRDVIEKEYYVPATDFYAFSHNADGTTDNTATIFPSVAWWDGDSSLQHSDQMFTRWASSEFSTDWGVRILSDQTSFYDPISYHQGTVWPLFTGWLSVAEYRANHPLDAYLHLMQNANLTWSQDLGSTTELLSGEFYQILGRSTAHQLWSSAMVVSPVLRGMFGLEWDAQHHSLTLNPHLPADWDRAIIRSLPFGDRKITLSFVRNGQRLTVEETGSTSSNLILHSPIAGTRMIGHAMYIPLPAVEVAIKQKLPAFGSSTSQLKIVNEIHGDRSLTLTLAAQASSRQIFVLRENVPGLNVHSDTAKIEATKNGLRTVSVDFPKGNGYTNKTVQLEW